MNSDDLTKHFERYRADWEINARLDSMWSVLSFPEKLGGGWTQADFYSVGEQEVREVFRWMQEHRIALTESDACLDFGSGLGRLTEALAAYFRQAVGVDISESMVQHARQHALAASKANVRYVLSTSSNLLDDFDPASFDFIYSNITLQHLNGDLQKSYLRQFATLLKPGAFAVVQIPSEQAPAASVPAILRSLSVRRLVAFVLDSVRLGIAPWRVRMELNILSEKEAVEVAKQAGLALVSRAYIDWAMFYNEAHRFVLSEKVARSRYPTSPMYFFQRT